MVWWAMIVGHLALGFLYALIFGRWAGISTFATGAKAGAVIGALISLGYSMILYGTTHVATLTAVSADIIITAVMSAIIGGVVGWYLER